VAVVFEKVYRPLSHLIAALADHFHGVKVSLRVIADMIEVTHGVQHKNDVIGAPFSPVTHEFFIPKVILNSVNIIIQSFNLYLANNSNWEIESLNQIQLFVAEYNPIRGRGFLELPPALRRRHSLVSIKTENNCFLLSILCSIFNEEILAAATSRHPNNVKRILENPKAYTPFLGKIDLSFLKDPSAVSIPDIDVVEQRLPDISVNVYGLAGDVTILLRATEKVKRHHVDLLLVRDEKNLENFHYILVRDFGRFQGKHQGKWSKYCQKCHKKLDARCKNAMNHLCGEGSTLKKSPRVPTVKFLRFDALLKSPYCMYYRFFYARVKFGVTNLRNMTDADTRTGAGGV